jgi:hypothetical protein
MKQKLLFFLFIMTVSTAAFSQSTAKGLDRPDLAIYPNPVMEYIAVSDEEAIVNQIVIFNLVGKKVRTFDAVPNERFHVGDLPKGLYLIQLVDSNNKIINTQKVNKK